LLKYLGFIQPGMGSESIVKIETLYRGRIISLHKYHVSFRGLRFFREIVEHPGAVAVIPVKDDGRIVMIRQHRLPAGRSLVEIPAGTMRTGENEEECARRELLEETGYRARFLRKILSFYPAPGYSTEKITLFLANSLEKGEQTLEEDEAIEVMEIPVEEAVKLLENGLVEDAKTIIGLYWLAEQFKTVRHVG
jgi:ADP-ribose pyrophosphatase